MTGVPDIHSGFFRQRRNLLVVSLGLLAFQSTGAVIRTFSLLGNTIQLERPLSLATPLWVGWLYWLIRYYQYFRDLGDKGFGTTYRSRVQLYVGQLAQALFLRAYRPPRDEAFVGPSKRSGEFTRADVVEYRPDAWVIELHGTITLTAKNGTHSSMQMVQERVVIPLRMLWRPRLRAVWWIVVHTRLVSEYALPFAVATVPLGVELFRLVRRLAT